MDVEVGDISPEAARDIFRVALVGAEPTVDHAATATLRRQAIVDGWGAGHSRRLARVRRCCST